jgi:hypothetical protein
MKDDIIAIIVIFVAALYYVIQSSYIVKFSMKNVIMWWLICVAVYFILAYVVF